MDFRSELRFALIPIIQIKGDICMLVSAKEMLNKARDGKYAVGQFNINNLEWTKAILLTAQELK